MSVGTTTTFSELERYGRLYTGGKVAASADGTLLACTCGEELSLVDIATGKLLLSISVAGDELTAFALHPSKPELVTAGRSRLLRHWQYDREAKTSEQLRSWKAHKLPVVDLAYDETGTLVASAGADGAVMVFDVLKGFCTHVFRGHEGVVLRVLFQPSSLRLASCANDHTVRLWDLTSRECVHSLDGHVGVARALAFSPDGHTLFSGGADQIVNAWDTQTGKLTASLTVLEGVEAIVVDPVLGSGKEKKRKSAGGEALTFVTAGSKGTLRRWRVRPRTTTET